MDTHASMDLMDAYTTSFLNDVRSSQDRVDFTTAILTTRKAVKGIWKIPQHRYYTDHSIEHCERILERLWLLTRPCKPSPSSPPQDTHPLSDAEIYILLASTYLHDIGMQRELPNRSPSYIRKVHQDLSVEMVEGSLNNPSQYVDLGVLRRYADDINLVIQAHRHIPLDGDEYGNDQIGPDTVRVRLLGSLLRLADELELDERRVDLDRIYYQNPDIEPQAHWFRHAYIKSVTINDKHIKVNYAFPEGRRDECIYTISDYVQGVIEDTLEEIQQYVWDENAAFMLEAPSIKMSSTARPLPDEVLAELRVQADNRIREREQRVALLSTARIDDDLARAVQEADNRKALGLRSAAAAHYLGVARRFQQGGNYMRAADSAEQAAELLEAEHDVRAFQAHLLASQAYLANNDPRLARVPAEKALSLAVTSGNRDHQIEAHLTLSKIARLQMDAYGAQVHLDNVLHLREEQHDKH